jgi:hypothetical protein
MRAFSACSAIHEVPCPDNNFYPSWQYRLEVAWKQFAGIDNFQNLFSKLHGDSEIANCFKSEIALIEKLVTSCGGDSSVNSHPHAKIAYDEVKRLLPDAISYVEKKLAANDKWYNQNVIDQVPILVERLEKGIPPNEIIVEITDLPESKYKTQSARLTSILIAGWIYETYWQKYYDTTDNIIKYNTFSKLILKACEDICVMNEI